LISEVALSIKSSGFTKVVLLNSSPWNEELCDAVARDLRIEQGLQMFCISMSGLGLDLHPTRSQDRRRVQAVFTAITGLPPGPASQAPQAAAPAEDAESAGPRAFDSASRRLASLLREVSGRPPLRDGGKLAAAKLP
jgi:creatinine amidohydrolase